jgi:dTDP-glucose 4,6-dehydratase
MKLLVTGGAGFIGSHFVDYINQIHPDWQVYVLDLLTYAGSLDNLKYANCKIIEGDIRSRLDVAKVLQEGMDLVVNFAAETHVDNSLKNSGPFLTTNILGVYNLLEGCLEHKVQRFLQVSTDEVYGDIYGLGPGQSLETDRLSPGNPYASTKAAAEMAVMAYHKTYGLDAVITRGSNTYGPRQFPEKVIPLFIMNALTNKDLPIYGDGSAKRQYLYVEDHCDFIEMVLLSGAAGEAYNVGGSGLYNTLEIATEILAKIPSSTSKIVHVEDRKGHDMLYNISNTKLYDLKPTPESSNRVYDYEDYMDKTIKYYEEKVNAGL